MATPFTNDGTIFVGSQVLTIGAVAFVADNITVQYPSKVIERTDQNDSPSGAAVYATFVTGTAELQFATSATNPPALGATFTATFDT